MIEPANLATPMDLQLPSSQLAIGSISTIEPVEFELAFDDGASIEDSYSIIASAQHRRLLPLSISRGLWSCQLSSLLIQGDFSLNYSFHYSFAMPHNCEFAADNYQ